MRDFSAYLLYRASAALIAALPLPVVFRIGELAGMFAWCLLPGYRNLAFRNASVALGSEKSASEIQRMVRRHFRLPGANLLSSVKVSSMPPPQVEARVTIEKMEGMAGKIRARTPVVLVLSHLGNWELFSQLMPRCFPFMEAASVYQR